RDGLKYAADLINRAKDLNAFVAEKDKYREKLWSIQLEISKAKNPLINNKDASVLDPISNDVATRWNSTYLLLSQLLVLYEAIKRLQKDLAKDKERDVRNNAKALEKLLLDDDDLLGIQELVELLGPFAHVITIVGGDHYPTLSMMLPLVRILQEHLYQKEETLTHPIIHDVRDEIELSFGERWKEPGPEGYVAAMLDPRFKNLGFEPAKFESTKDKLKCRMMEYIENNNYSLPNNNLPTFLLSSLFKETTHQSCPVETKLKIYFDMPKMAKYDLSDPLYKKNNLLTFWHDNKSSLSLMAC
ncbi:18001_t:CDS:1, partial [Cetraspora pellucida]